MAVETREVNAADGHHYWDIRRFLVGAEAIVRIPERLLRNHPLRESMGRRRNYDPTNIDWGDAAIAAALVTAVLKFVG